VRRAVSAPNAAKPIGPYSPAIRAGNLLFISGQVGFDPATGALIDGGITPQTDQVMRNISALLNAAGASTWSARRYIWLT
jgi:2-iminobutanoate/2-iminopropanoate deaminase